MLSRSGPLGSLGWLFSFKAMVLAQAILVLPVVTALTRQTVEDAERAHGEQLRSMGAGPLLRSLLLAWDERYALLTVLLASFGRAISEVGAVMIVGGNIDGFTRVMTTAIALETSKGDLPLALALGMILLAVVLALNVLIALLRRWRERVDGAASSTPVAVFTTLLRLKNHHLAKLSNRRRAVYFEGLLGEILGGIADFPKHLNLPDQGRFSLGYYHQRQDFFSKSTPSDETTQGDSK